MSSMDTLMSLELLSFFSTDRQSCCAAWTILCFPSSGDKTLTVGLKDTTDTDTGRFLRRWLKKKNPSSASLKETFNGALYIFKYQKQSVFLLHETTWGCLYSFISYRCNLCKMYGTSQDRPSWWLSGALRISVILSHPSGFIVSCTHTAFPS